MTQQEFDNATPEEREAEAWKDIPEYEGLYQVSNLGRVRSLDNYYIQPKGGYRKKPGKLLKFQLSKTGRYPIVGLCKNNKHSKKKVHRLIAIAFIPNPNNYGDINHIDCNKLNFQISNLEWCNRSHNIRHAVENKLTNPAHSENHCRAKINNKTVIEIRAEITSGAKIKDIARERGLTYSLVLNIKNKKTWNHVR